MKKPTRVVHPPEVKMPDGNRPLVAPIYQSVKFSFDDVETTQAFFRNERDGYFYSRQANPTLRQLELTLAELQERDGCLLTSSGVAAVNLALLTLCKQGDHVLLFAEMYQPTRYMVRRFMSRYGVKHTMLSIEDTDGIERTLAETPTRLMVFESPSNPLLKIADLERITRAARAHDTLTLLDNTFAGFHNHGKFDIDLYAHSLTKYASGHGDVMGGAVIGSKDLVDSMRADVSIIGPTLDPHAAFLIQRGLKTYYVRYQRQCETALRIAQFLERYEGVARVHYPGLPSHPRHALAKAQMSDFGTIVTIELEGDGERTRRFVNKLRLFSIAASLGSTESLVQPGEMMRPTGLDQNERQWSGVSDVTVRLSIGLEDVNDLIADLSDALA